MTPEERAERAYFGACQGKSVLCHNIAEEIREAVAEAQRSPEKSLGQIADDAYQAKVDVGAYHLEAMKEAARAVEAEVRRRCVEAVKGLMKNEYRGEGERECYGRGALHFALKAISGE